MRKPSTQAIVYFVGIVAFGLFYFPMKAAIGVSWLFLFCALIYLLSLRLLGSWLAKRTRNGLDR